MAQLPGDLPTARIPPFLSEFWGGREWLGMTGRSGSGELRRKEVGKSKAANNNTGEKGKQGRERGRESRRGEAKTPIELPRPSPYAVSPPLCARLKGCREVLVQGDRETPSLRDGSAILKDMGDLSRAGMGCSAL